MDYNIFSNIAPAMPKPSKGTEFIKFAISQVTVSANRYHYSA